MDAVGGPWTQKSRAEGENLDHLPTYATLTKSPIEIGGEACWPPLGTRDFKTRLQNFPATPT